MFCSLFTTKRGCTSWGGKSCGFFTFSNIPSWLVRWRDRCTIVYAKISSLDWHATLRFAQGRAIISEMCLHQRQLTMETNKWKEWKSQLTYRTQTGDYLKVSPRLHEGCHCNSPKYYFSFCTEVFWSRKVRKNPTLPCKSSMARLSVTHFLENSKWKSQFNLHPKKFPTAPTRCLFMYCVWHYPRYVIRSAVTMVCCARASSDQINHCTVFCAEVLLCKDPLLERYVAIYL